MKDANYSALELYEVGYNAERLYLNGSGFTAREMKRGGFSVSDLKEGGYPLQDNATLYQTYPYYNPRELREAEYSAIDLKNLPNNIINTLSDGDEIVDIDDGIYDRSPTDGTGTGLELNIRISGGIISEAIVATAGSGYLIGDVLTVSINGTVLTFTLTSDNLTLNMFTILQQRNLVNGRYTITELKAADYNAAEMKAGEYTATNLRIAGYTAKELYYGANYTDESLSDPAQRDINGFSAIEIKNSGYSNTVLVEVGFPDIELVEILSLQNLKNAGFTILRAKIVFDHNNNIKTLDNKTLIVQNLLEVGYTADEIKNIPEDQIPDNSSVVGYTSSDFKSALFSVEDLLD